MDLELNEDEAALADGLRGLLRGRFGSDRIRAGIDRAGWDELAAAGVFSLRDDGFGFAEAAVVFECLGEHCVPGPLAAGFVAHGRVDGIATLVERDGDGRAVVEHLGVCDHVIVLDGEGASVVDADRVVGTPSAWPLDPLTPVSHVDGLPTGRRIADAAEVVDWRRQGAVLTAAFAAGMSARLTEMAVAYAGEREQFDRPIGSFQAVKHILADMLVRTEVSRAAVYAAAANLDDPDAGPLDEAVSTAKIVACEAAIANGKAATQVFGGMGYTWEVDVHLYLKRAWVLDTHFGSAAAHADALSASLVAAAAP